MALAFAIFCNCASSFQKTIWQYNTEIEIWFKAMLIMCLSGIRWYFVVPFVFVIEKISKGITALLKKNEIKK